MKRRESKRSVSSRRFGFYLALPAILVLLVLLAIPALLTLFQSLFVVPADGIGIGQFTNVDNYLFIFKNEIFFSMLLIFGAWS
jgi:ABC-type sugar transport system permease subunit